MVRCNMADTCLNGTSDWPPRDYVEEACLHSEAHASAYVVPTHKGCDKELSRCDWCARTLLTADSMSICLEVPDG
jgi:hypothetical protein